MVKQDNPEILGERHPQDVCVEKFKTFDEYMRTGGTFREEVIKHSHQILTLEKISMELKETIDKVDSKVDKTLEQVSKLVLEVTKITSVLGPDASVLKKLDDRLKSLETWRWVVVGGFAVIIFIIEKLWK